MLIANTIGIFILCKAGYMLSRMIFFNAYLNFL